MKIPKKWQITLRTYAWFQVNVQVQDRLIDLYSIDITITVSSKGFNTYITVADDVKPLYLLTLFPQPTSIIVIVNNLFSAKQKGSLTFKQEKKQNKSLAVIVAYRGSVKSKKEPPRVNWIMGKLPYKNEGSKSRDQKVLSLYSLKKRDRNCV